jgi:hypothetical protein
MPVYREYGRTDYVKMRFYTAAEERQLIVNQDVFRTFTLVYCPARNSLRIRFFFVHVDQFGNITAV